MVVMLQGIGCLLPALIVGNLFFGLFLFRFVTWFLIEAVLIGILFLTSLAFMRKFLSTAASRNSRQQGKGHSGTHRRTSENVIDTEGEIVEDHESLPEK